VETKRKIPPLAGGAVLATGPTKRQFLALMLRSLIHALVCVVLLGVFGVFARAADVLAPVPTTLKAKKVSVIVIPVQDEISEPIHYILRRGLKQGADVVVLDMKTPGGRIDVTFDIFEDLKKFSGQTITYVNNEAMSAGALIAVCTDEIYFAPLGVIGAAAPVTGEGKDLEKTMKGKVVSYVTGKARAVAEGKGRYREQVVTAMIDDDTELKIDGKVLKEKGKLLTLTLTEASAKYGDPAQPLLAAGIAKDIDDLLTQKYGAGNYEKLTFEVTWSEKLAQILSMRLVVQALLALGALAIYIEFKIPGFGVFGITGAVLLGLVFFGSYFSGLSGHEPILVFAIGVILLALELAFFHTAGVFGIIGLMMMGGSLLWAMADFWPNQPISVAWSGDLLLVPLQNMLIAVVVAGVLLALIARFLPHGWIWQRLAVGGAVSGAGVATEVLNEQEALVGREGIAATSLFPSGQVEIDGRRHEARLEVGSVQAGTPIRVVRRTSFGLVVEEKKS